MLRLEGRARKDKSRAPQKMVSHGVLRRYNGRLNNSVHPLAASFPNPPSLVRITCITEFVGTFFLMLTIGLVIASRWRERCHVPANNRQFILTDWRLDLRCSPAHLREVEFPAVHLIRLSALAQPL